MKELCEKIRFQLSALESDMHENVYKGNKSAGVRARKATRELEKMFKEYRKVSLEAVKK